MFVNVADFNPIWPIIILWAVAAIFGKKKKPVPRPGASAGPAGSGPGAAIGAMSGAVATDLAHALQALKAAEASARHAAAPDAMPDQAARARAYLESRKAQAPQRRAQLPPQREVFFPKPRPSLVLEDDSDQSQETGDADATDFDDQAEGIVNARLKEAEEFSRVLAPDESRRLSVRPAASPSTAEAPAAPALAGGILARFATGRARDALILGEILGRPMGERLGG